LKALTEDQITPEEQIVKKILKQEKKRALISARDQGFKQIVKIVTIEGEHTCLLKVRADLIEIVPINNAPHMKAKVILAKELKFVLAYKYMYRQRGIRLVLMNLEEIIVISKDEDHSFKLISVLITINPGVKQKNEEILDVERF
jgi:hypothetical protein